MILFGIYLLFCAFVFLGMKFGSMGRWIAFAFFTVWSLFAATGTFVGIYYNEDYLFKGYGLLFVITFILSLTFLLKHKWIVKFDKRTR